MLLCELTAPAQRLALVGLAKNTGKTVALNALLEELRGRQRTVAVTTVGRDGEERDAIDFRIEKPRVRLVAGSLVATTDGLLRASGLPHELLEQTDVRTPLGRVVIARLRGAGEIEIAGPSAAADVRAVSDTMLAQGAEQVLIDGAVDRRAASSPDVSDGLVISTGAVLSSDIDEVVAKTVDAVQLVRLGSVSEEAPAESRLRELAHTQDHGAAMLVDESLGQHPMPPRFVLTAAPAEIERLMRDALATPRWLLASGAVPEAFLNGLVSFTRRAKRTLTVVVSDATKVFLSDRSVDFYANQGVELRVLHPIALRALTVNPQAPQSHSFDSKQLRALLIARLPELPVFDVMHPEYLGSQGARYMPGARS